MHACISNVTQIKLCSALNRNTYRVRKTFHCENENKKFFNLCLGEISSSLLFLGFIFCQCCKTFLSTRTFCFDMLKETFLLRRKKILWRRRLKQGNFLVPFSKTQIILVENVTRPKCTGFPVSDWLIHSSS